MDQGLASIILRMAHLENRRLIIGGKPRLVLAGEVHYFRLKREAWPDRIEKTKRAGCNAVASYIPWLYHEETEGDVDLTGRKAPERDLGAFIDLCKAQGLWFIARPGPFIMGEVKNEGIPDWVYTKYPEAVPTTWNGKKASSKNLNVLDPGFLSASDRWYEAVMPSLAARLDSKGGNVIAVQLDNEIGMLQCWTEEPDLSESVLCEFTEWVQKRRSPDELRTAYPFDIADPTARRKALQDGTFPTARSFHMDYTEFNRDRYARYAAHLRRSAEKNGVRDVPFIVNIHGSGGGRAMTFPIGISQTYRAYTQEEGYWGSSDHYLGELTRQNVQDLYFLNAFMACVNRPEQPLSSVEFEAGTGDYGESGATRHSGAATDFKARLSVVQGNRMLNHYLLAGGHNPLLEKSKQDGNSRVGTTGGRHGFAAPIGPEGQLDPLYHHLAETNETLRAIEDHLAVMEEEYDGLVLGFIPDYYSTDVKRPGPMQALVSKLEQARAFLENGTRSLLRSGLSFRAWNLAREIPSDVRCLMLASSEVLHHEIQERLLGFVEDGGALFLYGRIPTEDMEGLPCSILASGLGIHAHSILQGSPEFFPSIQGSSFAQDEPEVRVWQVQPFEAKRHEPFLGIVQQKTVAGSTIAYGKGKVCLITAEIPAHATLWEGILSQLGVRPAVTHDDPLRGILLNRLRDEKGQRFVSLINLDMEDKEVSLRENGELLMPQRVFLARRTAKLLPVNVRVGPLHVVHSTAEVMRVSDTAVTFRRSAKAESVVVRGAASADGGGRVRDRTNGLTEIELHPGSGGVMIRPRR